MDLVAAGRRGWDDGNEKAVATADASAQVAAPSGHCRTAAWNTIDVMTQGTAGMEASKIEKSRFRQWLARPPIPHDTRSTRRPDRRDAISETLRGSLDARDGEMDAPKA